MVIVRKFRSIKKDINACGHEAPVVYLQTWQSRAFDMDLASHRKWRPSRADVRQFLEAQGQGD